MANIKWMTLAFCLLHCTFLDTANANTGALTLVQTEENNDDATVEVNGEDSVPMTHFIDESAGEFRPTDQWQTVKEGQAIPAGLHVRLNLETGEREAKLLDGDVGLKYWKAGDREGMINKDNHKFSTSELKRALKDFKTTKLDETDLERERDVKSKFRSYEDLKKEFGTIDMGIKTDGQIVEELVTKLQRKDIEDEVLSIHLQDLEYYLHQYDNAVVFKDYGGLKVLVKFLNSTKGQDIKAEAAMVMGSACSSNPEVQIVTMETGALQVLLNILSTDKSLNLRRKVLYAVSTMCRNFPHAQERFLHLGGLSVLGQVFKESEVEKLQVKAVSFLNDLLVEKEDVLRYSNPDKTSEAEKMRQYNQVLLRESMIEQGWCELIPPLLKISEHHGREQVLKIMKTLGESCSDKFMNSRTRLRDLQKEYKVLYVEEAKEEEDGYYSHMLLLVEGLMTLLNVKEEL